MLVKHTRTKDFRLSLYHMAPNKGFRWTKSVVPLFSSKKLNKAEGNKKIYTKRNHICPNMLKKQSTYRNAEMLVLILSW